MPTRLYSYYYPLLSSLLVLGSGASEQHQLSSQPPFFALEEEDEECGIYLAQSTIANAGFGLFAGKDYSKNELLLHAPSHGDIVIPIVDFKFHSVDQREFYFLWNDYVSVIYFFVFSFLILRARNCLASSAKTMLNV